MKKAFSVMLALVVCICSITVTNVSAATDNEKQFAKDFVEEATGENFVMLDKQKVYSLDETLFGYKVNFKNQDTGEKGYIIFSKGRRIVEYAFGSEDTAFEENKLDKLYYAGNLDYYFKNGANFVSEEGDSYTKEQILEEKEKQEVLKAFLSVEENAQKVSEFNSYVELENYVENEKSKMGTYSGGATVEEGVYITNPSDVTSNIDKIHAPNFVDLYYLNYVKMSDFSSLGYSDHCGLTALLNEFIYWDQAKGYSSLIQTEHPYTSEIQELRDYAGGYSWLNFWQVKNAMRLFAEDKLRKTGFTIAPATDYWVTHDDVIKRVQENRPFVLLVNGNSRYGDHYVVGLGYQMITCWYNNIFGVRCTEDVLFVKVADGHIDKANRYINFEDASLRWMVWLVEVEDHGI